MSIWRRWFGKSVSTDEIAAGTSPFQRARPYDEAQLRAELRQLMQQRETLELRGCFSDRDLDAKDRALERLDERIKILKNLQFRLRTYGKAEVPTGSKDAHHA
jgi:hypothetical protein